MIEEKDILNDEGLLSRINKLDVSNITFLFGAIMGIMLRRKIISITLFQEVMKSVLKEMKEKGL
jgi:hypothetical protein